MNFSKQPITIVHDLELALSLALMHTAAKWMDSGESKTNLKQSR
jgi:hypothetical protein